MIMNISAICMFVICMLYGLTRGSKYSVKLVNKKISNSILFLTFCCIMLWFFAAFRGDFTQDYFIYYWNFEHNLNLTFMEIINESRDFLFWIFTKPFTQIFGNSQGGFIVATAVTIFAYFEIIKKESVNYFLTLMLYVAIDNYAVSFNLMRNCLAAALCAWSIHFIWEKKFWKYFMAIIVIAMIHKSALIMIPMYWILQIDFRKRKNSILLIAALIVAGIGLLDTKRVTLLGQAFIGMDYLSYDDYGLDIGSVGSAIKTVVLFSVLLFFKSKIEFENIKERVLFNSCILCCYFQVLAAQVLMVQRVAYYFSFPYTLMIPLIISRIRNKKTRAIVQMVMVVLLFIYVIFVQNSESYYFVWNNVKCLY